MAKLWFEARRYGWGWTPVTVEGWIVTALFVAAVFVNAAIFIYRVRTGYDVHSAKVTFYAWLVVLVVALIAICWLTGERPRWRWGD
jgi:hypothetical protein